MKRVFIQVPTISSPSDLKKWPRSTAFLVALSAHFFSQQKKWPRSTAFLGELWAALSAPRKAFNSIYYRGTWRIMRP